MIYPQTFEHKTGFDRIRDLISAHCLCPLGIEKVQNMHFSSNFDEVNLWLDLTAEFRQICLMDNDFPIDNYIDASRFLRKARIEGAYLEPEELFALKRSLDTIRSILNFLKRDESEKYPRLRELSTKVQWFPFVSDRIDAILTSQGRIKDNASPTLADIRRKLAQKQGEVSKRMHQMLKKAQSEGWISSDTSLSIRDGILVIPVEAANKRRIRGMIRDESSTGKTSFIEPEESIEMNNEIRELENDERREIIRILIALCDAIRPYLSELLESYNFLGEVDFVRAKALFALDLNADRPAVQNQPLIRWGKAYHPLLSLRFKKEGKKVIPLDIEMNETDRIVLISGPNAGGKSVCMQTVGLLQYMLQCGLLIPIKASSEAGIFENIFIDIGDDQSLENDLSTYSSHLENMKFFLRNANEKTLILIDELGSGTEPTMGGAIAESILSRLNEKQVRGVITTHFTNLKLFASETEGIVNGAMMFDNHIMQPLYQLSIGQPGSSFAFEIARKIGLPDDVLRNAADKLGEDHMNFDKHLRELVRDKRYWEQKRQQIKEKEKRLEETLSRYQSELEGIKEQRKQVISSAKKEAQELLSGVNKKIENTIFSIKEANAEKEKTRELRKDLDDFKAKALENTNEEDDAIARKMEQLRQREERKKQKQPAIAASVQPKKEKEEAPLAAGDKVRMKGQDTPGVILSLNGKQATIAFGNLTTSLTIDRIERISHSEYKKQIKEITPQVFTRQSVDIGDRKLNFRAQIDVRGMRADEALAKVTEFIDEAIMVDASEVRILHGKGNGILRQLIRDLLNTINVIEYFGDEDHQFGGAGITVVKFE
jgi:DNA mismatch repair protein MutS2